MKMKILAMMFVAALAFSACGDDDNENIAVPESISQALKTKYPSATHIEWSQKGKYFVADCRVEGNDTDVWFNAQAQWQLTETDILWNDIPTAVQEDFNSKEYASWKREDIDLLEYPSLPNEVVIEVEKGEIEYQLFYSEEGDLILKKDVTSKDDTNWPK